VSAKLETKIEPSIYRDHSNRYDKNDENDEFGSLNASHSVAMSIHMEIDHRHDLNNYIQIEIFRKKLHCWDFLRKRKVDHKMSELREVMK
jgi:hypothetical protein